nr:hypothetical protein [Tanacetum cinerariifolium]
MGQFSHQWKYLIHTIMQCLSPKTDEPASPLRDVSQGEACPTDSGFIADQDRATIAKSSTLTHDSALMVTSSVADEGSMQQTINELTALCTSLQRQHSEMIAKFEAQEVEINRLKARVKLLEDREGVAAERSRDDAPIKGRNLNEGEAVAERVSDDTEEMATVLTSMDAATVLASGVAGVPTGSGSIPTASPPAAEVPLAVMWFPLPSQQRKPLTKKQQREFYTAVLRNQAGWKAKHFKGMTLEEIKENFNPVWKQLHDFVPIGSKEEAERFKRKGTRFEQESTKKLKTSEEVPEEVKSPDEVLKENVKEMMQLDPIEDVYVEALQVKHLIIDWKNLMHAPVEWKLYDSCGVHHVTAIDKEIFMLVEKDYPLRKGLAIVMISYTLQVKNYSRMANNLILKIFKIASTPRQQGD